MTTSKATAGDLGKVYDNPITELVRIAGQFQSRILLKSGSKQVNAKSMMGVMAFGLSEGTEVEIVAEGEDEAASVKAVEDFLACK